MVQVREDGGQARVQAAEGPGVQLGVQAGQVLSPLAGQQGWRLVGKWNTAPEGVGF